MSVTPDPHREYWENRLAGGPSIETVGWIGLGRGFNREMYRVRATSFRRYVTRALRRHRIDVRRANVLDIGSGSGFYIDQWKQLGVHALQGIDLTDAVVSALSQRYPDVPFLRMDAGEADIDMPAEAFDAISCMDVLFHIMEDHQYRRCLQNVARLLKPHGFFVFTENCLHGERKAGPHQISRSLSEVIDAVHAAGLHIVERRPAFVLMNTPIDSSSALLRRWWGAINRIATKNEMLGSLAGTVLAPVETVLTRVVREGPSTEFLVATHRNSCNAADARSA